MPRATTALPPRENDPVLGDGRDRGFGELEWDDVFEDDMLSATEQQATAQALRFEALGGRPFFTRLDDLCQQGSAQDTCLFLYLFWCDAEELRSRACLASLVGVTEQSSQVCSLP
eukprot:m.409483 g.409483  ORF g.409483 m.409483 type:complete len:115 (-) comp20155_c2_seq8:3605-3949(-)